MSTHCSEKTTHSRGPHVTIQLPGIGNKRKSWLSNSLS